MSQATRVVLDKIRYIVRSLRLSSRAAEKSCGLSTAQLFVLRALEGDQGTSINELAVRTMTHQSSVSVVVKKLVEQGLVSKHLSKADSRRVELALSRAGRAKLQECPPLIQEHLMEALNRMKEPDRNSLARLLTVFVKEAGLDDGPAPLFFEDSPKRNISRKKRPEKNL